ncbi:MAG: STN domain-containing protein, partial [Phycisphaerae bacterium]
APRRAVDGARLEVVPKDVVRRLARAPTWDELETLRWLSTSHPGSDPSVLESLRPRVQFRVGVPGAWTPLSKAIADVGAGAGDEVLTVACRNLGWSWSLAGKHIVIAPAQERIREQLRAVLSIRLNNRPLIDILQAVGKRVGVRIAAEPGAVSTLPDDVRGNVSVNAQNQPAEQVLDAFAANTGLGYIVVPDGVIFYRPGNIDLDPRAGPGAGPGGEPTPGGARPAGDPYVAKVTIPLDDGTSIEWLIRRSELPEDLRARRRRDLDRLFDAVRRHAADNPP